MHQKVESRAGDNFRLSTPYPKQFYKHTLYNAQGIKVAGFSMIEHIYILYYQL